MGKEIANIGFIVLGIGALLFILFGTGQSAGVRESAEKTVSSGTDFTLFSSSNGYSADKDTMSGAGCGFRGWVIGANIFTTQGGGLTSYKYSQVICVAK